MKALLFACLCVISTAALSTELRIGEQRFTIRPDCTLEIKYPDGSQERKTFPLRSGYGECAIINRDGTNIPHLERMPMGFYIFLVESRKGLMEACRAEYWGVMVPHKFKEDWSAVALRPGDVKIIPKTRRSKACGADQDRKEFEYLYGQRAK